MKNIGIFFSVLTFIYLLLGLLLFLFQRHVLYFPTPEYQHPYQTLTFHQDDETLKVIVLNPGQVKSLMFFGGNAEAVINSAPEHLQDFPDYTVYLVNYRGYGGSSGMPQETTIYSDALHIYDQIAMDHPQISIMGRSLGTGVATYIASKRTIQQMILITPYDSIEQIARFRYPIYPVSILLKDKFDSISRVKNIRAKTLIILAETDKLIPFESSMRLVNAFPSSQVQVKTIADTGHNSLSHTEEYHDLLRAFMLDPAANLPEEWIGKS